MPVKDCKDSLSLFGDVVEPNDLSRMDLVSLFSFSWLFCQFLSAIELWALERKISISEKSVPLAGLVWDSKVSLCVPECLFDWNSKLCHCNSRRQCLLDSFTYRFMHVDLHIS